VPSRMDNLPTVVIEAMSINTPVIAARAGGIPYMINDQKDGILVQPESIEELNLALENIINDVEFRDALAISAKEKFDLHFTMEGHVKNVVSFLNSLN
jgi:L-malate glycosyltransferase